MSSITSELHLSAFFFYQTFPFSASLAGFGYPSHMSFIVVSPDNSHQMFITLCL